MNDVYAHTTELWNEIWGILILQCTLGLPLKTRYAFYSEAFDSNLSWLGLPFMLSPVLRWHTLYSSRERNIHLLMLLYKAVMPSGDCKKKSQTFSIEYLRICLVSRQQRYTGNQIQDFSHQMPVLLRTLYKSRIKSCLRQIARVTIQV